MEKRILIIGLILGAVMFWIYQKPPAISEKLFLFRNIINEFADHIHTKEHMFPIGKGGSLTGGENGDKIREFALSLEAKRLVNVEEARHIAVKATEELLEIINTDEKIRPYLDHYPYTAKGVDLTFSFLPYEEGHPETAEQFVYSAFVNGGTIRYYHYIPEGSHHKIILREPYEEALEKEKMRLGQSVGS